MAANQYPYGVGRLPADALNAAIAVITPTRVGVRVRRVAVQSIPNAGSPTPVSFDQEDEDTSAFFALATPTVCNIPSDGIYAISVQISTTSVPGTGRNFLDISLLGSTPTGTPPQIRNVWVGGEGIASVAGTVRLLAGNQVQVAIFQTSGAPQNFTVWLQIWKVSI